MNPTPFDALADGDDGLVRPDAAFASRLRRRLERAVLELRDDPVIDVPERTTTPTSATSATNINPTSSPTSDQSNSEDHSMTDTSTPTPPTQQILTPYISVHDGPAALDWYRDALGADEIVRYVGDDGRLGHGEFLVAGARVMISDAYPEIGVVAANSYEGSSCALHLEVADCDVLHDQAVEHGATSSMPPTDQPHGARSATIIDPFGHRWMLSQHIEHRTVDEIDAAYDGFTVTEPD